MNGEAAEEGLDGKTARFPIWHVACRFWEMPYSLLPFTPATG